MVNILFGHQNKRPPWSLDSNFDKTKHILKLSSPYSSMYTPTQERNVYSTKRVLY